MSSPPQLVIVARALPHHAIGGMQAVAWDLAMRLAEHGTGVTVLTTAVPGRPERFEDGGVRVRALPSTSWRRYGSRWWRGTRQVFQQELSRSCDLVFSVSAGGFGLLPLRSSMPRLPFVLQAHGTSMAEAKSKWRSGDPRAMAGSLRNMAWIVKDLDAYRRFDAVVAVGDRVAQDLSTGVMRHFVDSGRLRIIHNGVDTVLFRPDAAARGRIRRRFGWSDSRRVIVSVGRLHRQKGLDLGLDAFAAQAEQQGDSEYLIVGEGPERDLLRRRARDLGVGDRVHFVGGVSRQQVAEYLNAADTMLFTTTHLEGNPLNVLEALAVGLPVVASEHLRGTLPSSDAISFVDPRDAGAVASRLRSARAMLQPRQSRLPEGYSMTESLAQYLRLFAELLGEKP